MNSTLIVLVIFAMIVVIIVLVARSRRANDGVDSFRRQIDALSPEARRPVIDQVQNAAGRPPTAADAADADSAGGDAADDDNGEQDDKDDDEDGARGT